MTLASQNYLAITISMHPSDKNMPNYGKYFECFFTCVERPKFTLSPVNSTDDDIICMDNKSDTPTVLSHTSVIGMY